MLVDPFVIRGLIRAVDLLCLMIVLRLSGCFGRLFRLLMGSLLRLLLMAGRSLRVISGLVRPGLCLMWGRRLALRLGCSWLLLCRLLLGLWLTALVLRVLRCVRVANGVADRRCRCARSG